MENFWYTFGVMNFRNDVCIADLEATSTEASKNHPSGNLVIEDAEIVEQYATDDNPHEHLDSHIKELTGLTDNA